MQHVLLGYGYSAYHLAQVLLNDKQEVIAYSRTPHHPMLPGLNHQCLDLAGCQPLNHLTDACIYYFIPPSDTYDALLSQVLAKLPPPKKIIYIGSSAIYGDHQGAIVNENAKCYLETPRQQQRQAAENRIWDFANKHQIPAIICRLAGIYGPGRLPVEAVKQQLPVVTPAEAPLINHIFVQDLSYILAALATKLNFSGVINLADGHPIPMGQLQQKLAKLLNCPPAPEINFTTAWDQASPMRREFLSQNKILNIDLLKKQLKILAYELHQLDTGLKLSLNK